MYTAVFKMIMSHLYFGRKKSAVNYILNLIFLSINPLFYLSTQKVKSFSDWKSVIHAKFSFGQRNSQNTVLCFADLAAIELMKGFFFLTVFK